LAYGFAPGILFYALGLLDCCLTKQVRIIDIPPSTIRIGVRRFRPELVAIAVQGFQVTRRLHPHRQVAPVPCFIKKVRPLISCPYKDIAAGEGDRSTTVSWAVVILCGADEPLDGFDFSALKVIKLCELYEPLTPEGLCGIFGMQVRQRISKPLVRGKDAPYRGFVPALQTFKDSNRVHFAAGLKGTCHSSYERDAPDRPTVGRVLDMTVGGEPGIQPGHAIPLERVEVGTNRVVRVRARKRLHGFPQQG